MLRFPRLIPSPFYTGRCVSVFRLGLGRQQDAVTVVVLFYRRVTGGRDFHHRRRRRHDIGRTIEKWRSAVIAIGGNFILDMPCPCTPFL